MKTRWILMLVFAITAFFVSTIPGLAQARHDCTDYCATNDVNCQLAWHEIHDDHNAEGICSNHPSMGPAALEGYCFMSWSTLRKIVADTTIDCRGNVCNLSGTMPCGGTRKPYAISCTESTSEAGISDAPQASAGFNFARCQEFNGNTTTVSCNEGTGELVTFYGSN